MLLNKYAVIYLVLTGCALAVSLIGVMAGFGIAGQAELLRLSPESRHRLEQRLYLGFSAIGIGLLLKLILIPGWFFMLQSLIPSIPGAMCLIGVHQNVPIVSWLASGLKLFLPAFYMGWLVISLIDRQIPSQPYLKIRRISLLPLLFFILLESAADLYFLFSIKPLQVNCCSLITESALHQQKDVTADGILISVLVIMGFILMILSRKFVTSKLAAFFVFSLGVFFLILLVPAFHARLTPVQLPSYFTNKIYHNCIFCLLRSNLYALFSFILLYTGGILSLAVGASHFLGGDTIPPHDILRFSATYRRFVFLSLGAGLVFLFLSLI